MKESQRRNCGFCVNENRVSLYKKIVGFMRETVIGLLEGGEKKTNEIGLGIVNDVGFVF